VRSGDRKHGKLAAAILLVIAQANAQTVRTVHVDVAKIVGPHSEVPLRVVGAGRAEEGLRADWQAQLKTVQNEIGFRYLRMHGVLNDEMGVYNEDAQGHPQINFQYVDTLYDALLAMHIRPFVELTFMPSKLANGKSTVFWWKGNTSPPKDPEKWAMLIRALVEHWKERYGEQEITQWYYEVWNEPDIRGFWPYPLEEYFKLYKTTAEAVKQACPRCRVGGPATAVPYRGEEEFERWAVTSKVPVDFISAHAYGVKQGYLDADGTAGTILDADLNSVSGRMRHSRELLQASGLSSNLELHFTEWSSAYTPTDYMHDQYHQASFILDKVRRATAYVDSLSYWTFTDIFEENGPRMTPFHGGFGMINLQGIKKPSFYAFRFLSQLGTQDMQSDDAQSWVTRSSDGSVQALLWDYTPVVPSQGQTDQTFYKREQPALVKGSLKLELSGLRDGRYKLSIYQTGYHKNDAYSAYLEMGSPDQLTRSQVSQLNASSSGAATVIDEVSVKNGRFARSMPLSTNDVFLLILTPIGKGQPVRR
jgi:xylan 1,4-beta-xylosidase